MNARFVEGYFTVALKCLFLNGSKKYVLHLGITLSWFWLLWSFLSWSPCISIVQFECTKELQQYMQGSSGMPGPSHEPSRDLNTCAAM